MKRMLSVIAVVSMIALAGCGGFVADGGAEGADLSGNESVDVENNAPDATSVNQTLRIAADEETAGSELTAIGATYPREDFTVDTAQHEDIVLGVDTDGDGQIDREFNESHISGVNNNEYSFDVTLDTDYALEEGDVVMVQYPAINNPAESGNYEVEIRLNDGQTSTGTITIE